MDELRQVELPVGFGQTRGSEHEVWLADDGKRVIKATHAGEFGRKFGPDRFATCDEYLERIRLMNSEFSLDWRVEGRHGIGSQLRIVTSQPLFGGEPPGHRFIQVFMKDFAFRHFKTRFGDAWYRDADGLLISDAEPKNAVMSGSLIFPFDFLIARPAPELLALAGMR